MTLRVGLTHPALTKLTFMDYLLTMLRNRLRRKHSYDNQLLDLRSSGSSDKVSPSLERLDELVAVATGSNLKVDHPLRTIRVMAGALVDQIEFCFTDGKREVYGTRGGSRQPDFELGEDEYLHEVQTRVGDSLDAIRFGTSKGRFSSWYGNTRGALWPVEHARCVRAYPPPPLRLVLYRHRWHTGDACAHRCFNSTQPLHTRARRRFAATSIGRRRRLPDNGLAPAE